MRFVQPNLLSCNIDELTKVLIDLKEYSIKLRKIAKIFHHKITKGGKINLTPTLRTKE